jgi:hypothetical protein
VLGVSILLILILLVGGGVAIYRLSQKLPPAPGAMNGIARAQLLDSTEPVARPTTGPAGSDDDWDRVEQTYRTSPPELGIVALQDFINDPAHANYTSAAQPQIDEAMDRLWWIRLKGLCETRDDLQKQIADIDNQIATVKANGAVAERIAELQDQRDPLARELDAARDRLSEMKYTDPRMPDPYDEKQLADLRKSRNADAFAKWEKMIANSIIQNRGKLPW